MVGQSVEEEIDEERESEESFLDDIDDPEKNFPEYANEANKKINQNILSIKREI